MRLFQAIYRFSVVAFLLASLVAGFAADTNSVFLFSFFREPNGQNGLCLATSRDGLQWTEIKSPEGKAFIKPEVGGKLMRDPSLALGPDGTFHMVWTTSWGRPPVFGYASSKDLIHWSEQRAIPVMEDAPDAIQPVRRFIQKNNFRIMHNRLCQFQPLLHSGRVRVHLPIALLTHSHKIQHLDRKSTRLNSSHAN